MMDNSVWIPSVFYLLEFRSGGFRVLFSISIRILLKKMLKIYGKLQKKVIYLDVAWLHCNVFFYRELKRPQPKYHGSRLNQRVDKVQYIG